MIPFHDNLVAVNDVVVRDFELDRNPVSLLRAAAVLCVKPLRLLPDI